jgi:hypothetical protein
LENGFFELVVTTLNHNAAVNVSRVV